MEKTNDKNVTNTGMVNAFALAVKDIKTNAEKAGKHFNDEEIAQKLSISEDEFINYMRKDSPIGVFKKLITEFADYSRVITTEVIHETEHEAPGPLSPDALMKED